MIRPLSAANAPPPGNGFSRKGEYGLDAPWLIPVPLVLIAANLANGIFSRTLWPFIAAALIAVCMAFGLYASRRGKFQVWSELLDRLELRGDERVLDIGCGRGAVLVLAAQHLSTGKAVGVDIWKKAHQSGNAGDATWRSAVAESVADRVELATADMTAMPFADASFDVVLSNIAIHNVKDRYGRMRAISEAVRVLRPGGRLLIADLWATRLYCSHLQQIGMLNVTRRNLGWRVWWSGPWLATMLVTAVKPSSKQERDNDARASQLTTDN